MLVAAVGGIPMEGGEALPCLHELVVPFEEHAVEPVGSNQDLRPARNARAGDAPDGIDGETTPGERPEELDVCHRVGDESRIAGRFGQRQRPAGMRLGGGQPRCRVETPGETLLGLDLGGHIGAQFLERQFERSAPRLESLDVADHPPEPNQRPRAQSARSAMAPGMSSSTTRARATSPASNKHCPACSRRSRPAGLSAVGVRRAAASHSSAARIRCVPCSSPPSCGVEGRGDLGSGALGGGGEMPTTFFDIVTDTRQASVEAADDRKRTSASTPRWRAAGA